MGGRELEQGREPFGRATEAALTEEEKMSIITELLDLYEAKGNVLLAEDVVEFAKNEKTALHRHFTWDDSEAAILWRLQQARNIIRVSIQFSEQAPKIFRPLVNLIKDSTVPGGAYRSAEEVYNAGERQRQILVKQAMYEARRWRERYNGIAELAHVFAALEQVEEPTATNTRLSIAA